MKENKLLNKIKQKMNDNNVQKSLVVVLTIALGFSIYANMYQKYSPAAVAQSTVAYVNEKSTLLAENAKSKGTYTTIEEKTEACAKEMKNVKTDLNDEEKKVIVNFCAQKL